MSRFISIHYGKNWRFCPKKKLVILGLMATTSIYGPGRTLCSLPYPVQCVHNTVHFRQESRLTTAQDKTFTCTLFMPERFFNEIGDTREGLLAFFNKHFPDVIPLIGEEKLVTDYFRNSKLPLISIKVQAPA